VGFAGDFVACVLVLLLVRMIAMDDERNLSRMFGISTPTVSIYSALTDRLFTGRDMIVGEAQGDVYGKKLVH
jgi:hypothetical protein